MTGVGELVVRIRADAAQLEREMRRANAVVTQSTGTMGSSLSGLKAQFAALIPVLSTAAFVSFGKNAINVAGHITDLADRIGFAADTLAALEIPLAASGASLDEFTGAINRMNNILGEAAKGNEEAIRAFDQLGLSVEKLRSMSPEQQFYEIATALGQIKDQSTQTEAGMNLFGRGFSVLLPLLKEYEGDMRKAVDAQKELNDGLSEESLRRIDAFGDAMSGAGIRIRNTFLEAFDAILQVLNAIPMVEPAAKQVPTGVLNNTGTDLNLQDNQPVSPASMVFGQNAATTRHRDAHTEYPLEEAGSSGASGSNSALFARIQAQKDAAKATKEHTEKTKELTEANDELSVSMQEAARFQQILHDKLSQSLTDVVFRANSAKDAMLGFAEAIARAAFERKIAGPFADSLIGSSGNAGILDGLFNGDGAQLFDNAGAYLGVNETYGPPMQGYADGGRPPVGVPSIVGERGPEIFVPNTAGTVIPNHALGGSTVNVYQSFQINPGVPEMIDAKIREAAPSIASATHAAVFADIERGGKAARAVGRR